jgi:TonB family protein
VLWITALTVLTSVDPYLGPPNVSILRQVAEADSGHVYLLHRSAVDSLIPIRAPKLFGLPIVAETHVSRAWLRRLSTLLADPGMFEPSPSLSGVVPDSVDYSAYVVGRVGTSQITAWISPAWPSVELSRDGSLLSRGYGESAQRRSLLRALRDAFPDNADLRRLVLRASSSGPWLSQQVEQLPVPIETVMPGLPLDPRGPSDGTVLVRALVNAQGTVESVRVERSDLDPLITDAALEAVRKWRFKPAFSNGKPVACWVVVPVRFTLR